MKTSWKKLAAGMILAVGVTGAAWGQDWAHQDRHDRDDRIHREYNRDRDHDRDRRDHDWKRERYRYERRDHDRDWGSNRGWYGRGPYGRPGYRNGWWNNGFFGR